jgi:hypothetical protein
MVAVNTSELQILVCERYIREKDSVSIGYIQLLGADYILPSRVSSKIWQSGLYLRQNGLVVKLTLNGGL